MALLVPDARIIDERSSPLGLVSVVESPTIPFRHAPGLSLNNITEPPLQLGVFTDAEFDQHDHAVRRRPRAARISRLHHCRAAIPSLERSEGADPRAGGGEQVLLALYHRRRRSMRVELNPQVVDLVANDYAEFAGGIYGRPEVDVHVGEARSFVQRTDERYDLIQIPLLYSFGAAAAGTQSLHENYTYTVEAIAGLSRPLAARAAFSADHALAEAAAARHAETVRHRDRGAGGDAASPSPGARMALIRSWKTTTLLVKNGAFTADEIATI